MATVQPHWQITADNATDLAHVKDYLNSVGYVSGASSLGVRTDDDANLTVDVFVPTWTL